MTKTFDSKESALEQGLYYAGFDNSELRKKVMEDLGMPETMTIGFPQNKTVELYKFKTPAGEDAGIGIGECRGAYDLWLIDLKSGYCHRV